MAQAVSGGQPSGVTALAFADAQHGSGIVLGTIQTATSNGGGLWNRVSIGRVGWQAVTLRPSGTGWAVGTNGELAYTTDFGASWTRRSVSVSGDLPVADVQFPDPEHGWALLGNGQALLRTSQRGNPWEQVSLTGASGVDWASGAAISHSFPDRDTGYVHVGYDAGSERRNVVLKTVDVGSHWVTQPLPTTGYIFYPTSLRFNNHGRGVVVGERGTICQTQDGGQHWQVASSGTRRRLRLAAWADQQTVFALGDSLTLLRSRDAGRTWQTLALPTVDYPSLPLIAASFPNARVGYITLENNVFRTRDGGDTWQLISIAYQQPGHSFPSAFSPVALHFRTPLAGWALAGNVFATTDGGQTWTQLPTFGIDTYAGGGLTRTDRYNVWTWGVYGPSILRYSEKYLATAALAQTRYCAGQALSVAFTRSGSFGSTKQAVSVQLSNAHGRFRPGEVRVLAQGSSSPLAVTLPASLLSGSAYRLRVVRTDSTVLGGDNGQDITITALPAAPVVVQRPGGQLTVSVPVAGVSY